MHDLMPRIQAGEILVADGAMGTLLLERGLEPGVCPESINLTNPAVLEEIARLYLEAGADLVQTNTLGGSPLKLAMYGLETRTEDVNARAVAAARAAVGDRAYVYGSVGPCGLLLRPYGEAEPDRVRDGYVRQMRALVSAGIDAVCIETMLDLVECRLAIEAARAVAPALPVLATMTFDRTPRGFFTIMGVDVASAAAGLAAAGADVIGSNCGSGSETMLEIARAFAAVATRPLLFQPNAGLPRTVEGRAVYDESPALMAERARALLAAGAAIVGGCCGTTPEHIRALRVVVDEVQGTQPKDRNPA